MRLVFLFTALFICSIVSGQSAAPRALDSVAARVIHFFQEKQPDSVYKMTGKDFQEKITAENFHSITTTQIFPLNDFKLISFEKYEADISKYRVKGEPELQLLIGIDDDKLITTLLLQPYVQ